MFDVGFSEMVLLGLIALIVLGPEKLPRAARIVGGFMRKARHSFDGLKKEIEREIDSEEIKRTLSQIPQAAQNLENTLREGTEALSNSIQAPLLAAQAALTQPIEQLPSILGSPSPEPSAPDSSETPPQDLAQIAANQPSIAETAVDQITPPNEIELGKPA